jgi:hypothetical protein
VRDIYVCTWEAWRRKNTKRVRHLAILVFSHQTKQTRLLPFQNGPIFFSPPLHYPWIHSNTQIHALIPATAPTVFSELLVSRVPTIFEEYQLLYKLVDNHDISGIGTSLDPDVPWILELFPGWYRPSDVLDRF